MTTITASEITQIFEPLLRLACTSLDATLVGIYLREIDHLSVVSDASRTVVTQVTADVAGIFDHYEDVGSFVTVDHLAFNDEPSGSLGAQPVTLPDGQHTGTVYVLHRNAFNWTLAARRIFDDITTLASREYEAYIAQIAQKSRQSQTQPDTALFAHLAESLSDVVLLLDENTEITYCNGAIRDLLGYSPQEVLHHPVDILTAGSFEADVNQYLVNAFSSHANGTQWQAMRMQGKHKDGSSVAIEVDLEVIDDGGDTQSKLVIRNAGEQVEREAGLRADSTRYLQILDALPDLVFVKDPSSQLVWANQAFVDFFNIPLDDLIGKVTLDGLESPGHMMSLKDDHLVFTSERKKLMREESIIRHDGHEREFITTKIPVFDADSNPTLLVGISSDITETKNIERYLIDALEEREALVQMRTDFVSMVSHEFRTPLSVILSVVDILRDYHDRLPAERRQEKLVVIEEQVRRLTQLMDDVLVISRSNVKGLPFSLESANVIALSHAIIEEVQSQFRAKRIPSIDFSYNGETVTHNIDTNLFRHILQNLLSNALKYSPEESEVRVSMNLTENSITLVVSDTGIGIPEANQKDLFETFHRADNVGTIQGTGLGLAIVKRAVDTHGGTINFRSVENQGTMFVVKLDTQSNL